TLGGKFTSRWTCSPSPFAGSVGGAPISILRAYIEQQQLPAWRRARRFITALKDGAAVFR
ncbi:MAG: hypothetical protein ACRDL8_10285, partial [Solirubrobacteraceae bacterium]